MPEIWARAGARACGSGTRPRSSRKAQLPAHQSPGDLRVSLKQNFLQTRLSLCAQDERHPHLGKRLVGPHSRVAEPEPPPFLLCPEPPPFLLASPLLRPLLPVETSFDQVTDGHTEIQSPVLLPEMPSHPTDDINDAAPEAVTSCLCPSTPVLGGSRAVPLLTLSILPVGFVLLPTLPSRHPFSASPSPWAYLPLRRLQGPTLRAGSA